MIYVDMDGVLADFVGGVAELFGAFPAGLKSDWPKGEYDIAKVLGISNAKLWSEIDKKGPQFWSGLEPLPDGFGLIEQLHEAQVPWTIATSPSRSPASARGKVEWLQRCFGKQFRNYALIPNKHLLCAGPGDILLDDSEFNIEHWRKRGGVGELVPRPWNSQHQDDNETSFLAEDREGLGARIFVRWSNGGAV